MIKTLQTRDQVEAFLQLTGWKLISSERLSRPASDFEIWELAGYPYQLRLSWPVDGDCNGATTTEIEIHRALLRIRDAHFHFSGGAPEAPVFADGICPKCGRMCGNGGYGPLKCGCGWVDSESATVEVDRLFREEFGREEE